MERKRETILPRHLKEVTHMLGYGDLLSRPSIEMNTIWEPLIKKPGLKKICNMKYGKKKKHDGSVDKVFG